MPNYVSDGGVWHPAKEHAVLPHLSGTDKEIYDGPDRAAMEALAEAYGIDELGYPKQTTFGMPFKDDPDLINRARQLGYKSVMDYAVAMGYDPIKAKEDFNEKASVIVKHKDPTRKPEPLIHGGGISTAPNNETLIGGFGDERPRSAKELSK
jgi:hypothetical protein